MDIATGCSGQATLLILSKTIRMKHLTSLVPDGQSDLSTLASIIGAYEIFTRANKYRSENGEREVFKIELAGISKITEFDSGVVNIKPRTHISAIAKTHLIIVPPSLIRNYEKAGKGNRLLIDWIGKRYKAGAEVASICTGAFILASA